MADSTQHSRRMTTAYEVLEGYNSLSVAQILRPFDESAFTHHILPNSLGMPVRDRQSFSEHAAGITSVFEEFRMEPREIYEDAVRNTVILNARMTGKLKGGMGDWENECIMILNFSPDGKKVLGIQEFVDSAKAAKMREQMAPKDF